MIKDTVQGLLSRAGLSLHRKSSIDCLLQENERFKQQFNGATKPAAVEDLTPDEERERLKAKIHDYEIRYATTEDYHALDKQKRTVDRIGRFGEADFAELSCWIFASSLINHRIVHERIDEGSLLWRSVKMSRGPILEVGRAAGGSTLVLLGASGERSVVSIDRAPYHAEIADYVFRRPDVRSRLKLYVQTSREPIVENAFGMMFIDADHSYEGVCHDIATFWPMLKSFDGKPPLAAFHDAADNPITYVEPVKHACEELLAEPGAARVVESWGSMLVLEKTGEINPDRWYAKEHLAFWEQVADRDHPVLRPKVVRAQLYRERPALRLGEVNLFGDANVDDASWIKRGMMVERLQLNEDNPLRRLRETRETNEHGIEKSIPLNISRFNFLVFLRPHRVETIRLSILDHDRSPLAQVDFAFGDGGGIRRNVAASGVQITDAAFLYRNGYFGCDLAITLPRPLASATFAVNALDPSGEKAIYPGDGQRGLFINLWSVREIL